MKLKLNVITFFAVFTLALFNCGFLYAQEAGSSRDDSPQESAGVSIVPRDDELASLLTSTPNPNAVVRPLIQTKWSQGRPYNNMFPIGSSGNPVITGCGNIAWAQLMAYHRHPARGTGQSGQVNVRGISVPSVNFNIAYDWNNMLNTYRSDGRDSTEQQRNAVSTFVYHVAAARENYNSASPEVFTVFFGYDRSMQRLQRIFYTDAQWFAIIRQQLDAGLPVYYWGNNPGSDHAFIVDGYDSTGRFHINWGWGGSHDGWYSLDNLNPRGRREWYNNQRIVINFKPDAGGVSNGYEFALLNFSAAKTSVTQNEMFTVSARVTNTSVLDTFPGGRWGVALTDNNNNITAIIGDINASARGPLTSTNSNPFEINCFIPSNVNPGRYQLRIAVRPADGEWRIITRSAVGNDVPNAINVAVTAERGTPGGGYGLGLSTAFTASKTTVSHNETFTVNYRFRNMGQERFPGGDAGVALVDNNNNIVAVIQTRSIGGIDSGFTGTARELDCTVPNTVRPGRYQLRMVVRTAGIGIHAAEWRIATLHMPGIPTSIDFIVR